MEQIEAMFLAGGDSIDFVWKPEKEPDEQTRKFHFGAKSGNSGPDHRTCKQTSVALLRLIAAFPTFQFLSSEVP